MNVGIHTSQHVTGDEARGALTARAVAPDRGAPQVSIGGAGYGVHLVLGIEEAAMLLESLDQALAVAQERYLTLVVNGPAAD